MTGVPVGTQAKVRTAGPTETLGQVPIICRARSSYLGEPLPCDLIVAIQSQKGSDCTRTGAERDTLPGQYIRRHR